jgi:hypothetical protein
MSGLLREKACRHATGHKSRKEASAHQRRKSRLVTGLTFLSHPT